MSCLKMQNVPGSELFLYCKKRSHSSFPFPSVPGIQATAPRERNPPLQPLPLPPSPHPPLGPRASTPAKELSPSTWLAGGNPVPPSILLTSGTHASKDRAGEKLRNNVGLKLWHMILFTFSSYFRRESLVFYPCFFPTGTGQMKKSTCTMQFILECNNNQSIIPDVKLIMLHLCWERVRGDGARFTLLQKWNIFSDSFYGRNISYACIWSHFVHPVFMYFCSNDIHTTPLPPCGWRAYYTRCLM